MTTTAQLVEAMPMAKLLGIELQSATPAEVRGTMPWTESLCTSGGVLHGGALMAFADSLGGICAYLNLPNGASTATIESKSNLFRAVRQDVVSAITSPLHIGRSVIVVQTDLYDHGSRRIAQVTQTQAVLPGNPG